MKAPCHRLAMDSLGTRPLVASSSEFENLRESGKTRGSKSPSRLEDRHYLSPVRRVKDMGGCGEADGGLVVTNREQRGTVEN